MRRQDSARREVAFIFTLCLLLGCGKPQPNIIPVESAFTANLDSRNRNAVYIALIAAEKCGFEVEGIDINKPYAQSAEAMRCLVEEVKTAPREKHLELIQAFDERMQIYSPIYGGSQSVEWE